MIGDAIITAASSIFSAALQLLPASNGQSWLGSMPTSLVSQGFAFDNVLPLHESLQVLGIFILIVNPLFGFRVVMWLYSLLPFKST